VNPVLAAVISGALFVCLFVLPGFAAAYLVRRFGGERGHNRERAGSVRLRARCPSRDLEPRAADRVSPFPGYTCRDCRLDMRPNATTGFYVVLLVLSVAAIALGLSPLWADFEGNVFVLPCAFAVAVYSVCQLLRPTPRWSGPGVPR
jgi:hypothetical protein